VSIGGVQSNHTRQVAAVAAKLGVKCRLVLEKWVDARRSPTSSRRAASPMAPPREPRNTASAASAFAYWAYKVAEQEEQLGVFFDTIIVCTVTGSTHAGMIAGLRCTRGRRTPTATGARHRRVGDPWRSAGAQRLQRDRRLTHN
jgi:1-aminocyclopropane-1-carboxylate deaminase